MRRSTSTTHRPSSGSPRAPCRPTCPRSTRIGTGEILSRDDAADVFILAVGALAGVASAAADLIRAAGHGVTVVDPRWVKPIDPSIIELAASTGWWSPSRTTAVKAASARRSPANCRTAGTPAPVQVHAIDQQFLTHAKRDAVLADQGLSADRIAEAALEHMAPRKR